MAFNFFAAGWTEPGLGNQLSSTVPGTLVSFSAVAGTAGPELGGTITIQVSPSSGDFFPTSWGKTPDAAPPLASLPPVVWQAGNTIAVGPTAATPITPNGLYFAIEGAFLTPGTKTFTITFQTGTSAPVTVSSSINVYPGGYRTLAQVRNMVRVRLDETTATAWTDAEINGWINEGTRDVARRSETLQVSAQIPVTQGVAEYSAPPELVRVHRAEFQPTGDSSVYPLTYRDFNNMDAVWWTAKNTTQSTPELFTMWGYPPALKVILYPKPSRSGALNLYFYRVPVDVINDTDPIPVPSGWEDLIVEYATYLALRRDRDERWKEARQAYEDHLSSMMMLTRRWTDQAGEITPSGSMLPEWLVGGWDY